jgi:D-serine deaminase-like pyridoxal phosphate-dependent protein
LVDNIESAKAIATVASANNLTIPVYIDINVGMNRTGVLPESRAIQLYEQCSGSTGINPIGLHAYDGHIRHTDLTKRIEACDRAFALVQRLQTQLVEQGFPEPTIVAGGSPTFYVHAKRKNIECSPGTFIYWDKGYSSLCPEQSFLTSALVLTRIISLPDETKLCLDLGHKSVASENDLDKRVYFLNAPELRFVSHSEEHLVVETSADHNYKVGEVLYGLPFHICPTVALFERVLTVKNNFISGEWRNIARDRKITI